MIKSTSVQEKSDRTELDNKLLKKILDNIDDTICVTDIKTNRLIYVSRACEKHYGIKPEEIIGKGSSVMADKGYCFPPISPIFLHGRKQITLEQETRAGKKMNITATPIYGDNGNVEFIIETCRDVSELKSIKYGLEETKKLLSRYQQEVNEFRKKKLEIPGFIAISDKMKDLIKLTQKIAPLDLNVLLLGESGTGKSFIAKYIHKICKRKDGPFMSINCAAIPDELLESELFGYAPGAFTGARQKGKVGLLELANEGTIFLDEIGEIPLRLQAKLLEVTQEHQFMPIGGRQKKQLNCRIISATNRNLAKVVEEGKFRKDLYYRLNVIELEIPPLRERKDDILPIINSVLDNFEKKYRVSHEFTEESLERLIHYNWPGNVRELEHVIERLVLMVAEKKIKPHHLPGEFQQKLNQTGESTSPSLFLPYDDAVERFQKEMITRAYKQFNSSYKVAEALNISQTKASRLIRKYITNAKS